MPWRSLSGQYSEYRPIRLRLPDGTTITNEAITDEILTELGWWWDSYIPPEPEPQPEYVNTASEITVFL